MSLFASVVFLLLAAGNGVVLSDEAGEEGEIQSAPVWEEQLKEQAAFTQDQAKAEKIIGGAFFRPEFPHPIVLIRTYYNSGGRAKAGTCTGTVLNSRHVLTAAHCFTENVQPGNTVRRKNIQHIAVYIGLRNITELRMVQYYGIKQVPHAQAINVKMDEKHVVINPGWFHTLDWKRQNTANLADMAILKLDETIDFAKTNSAQTNLFAPTNIKTTPKSWYPNNRNAVVVGWGIVRWPDSSKELKMAGMETKTLAWCTKKSNQMGFRTGTMSIPDVFCGQGKEKKDTSEDTSFRWTWRKGRPQICFGDSGGPIFLRNSGKLVQVGISVWVDRTCSENFNGFLRINQHVDWIKKQVKVGTPISIVTHQENTPIDKPDEKDFDYDKRLIQREQAAIMAGDREDDEEGEEFHEFHESDDSQNPFYDRDEKIYVNTGHDRHDHVLDLILSCTN